MLLLHSDIHYLVTFISGSTVLIWTAATRSCNYSDTLSTKSLATSLLLASLVVGYVLWGAFGALFKYHYGYVQIPFRINFLQRPYATYPSANSWVLWMVEVGGVIGQQCRALGLYLGLVVLWNAASLVAGNCTLQNSHQPGYAPLAAGTVNTPLANSKRAVWMMVVGSSALVVAWLLQKWVGVFARAVLCVMLASVWVVWILLLQAKIKTVLLMLTRPSVPVDSDSPAGSMCTASDSEPLYCELGTSATAGNHSGIPRFRVKEQVRDLNTFSAFVLMEWVGHLGSTVIVGDVKSPFWLDIFSSVWLVGSLGGICLLFHLVYPSSVCNYRKLR